MRLVKICRNLRDMTSQIFPASLINHTGCILSITLYSTILSITQILQSLIVTDPEGSARSKHAVAAMPEALSMLLAWYRSLTEVAEPGTAPRHWFVLQFVPFVIEANFVLREAPL